MLNESTSSRVWTSVDLIFPSISVLCHELSLSPLCCCQRVDALILPECTCKSVQRLYNCRLDEPQGVDSCVLPEYEFYAHARFSSKLSLHLPSPLDLASPLMSCVSNCDVWHRMMTSPRRLSLIENIISTPLSCALCWTVPAHLKPSVLVNS